MNRLEHLLTVVMEECDETSQRVSKAKRFGLSQVQEEAGDRPEQNPDRLDNKQRIGREFHDLVASMEMAGLVEVIRTSQGMAFICLDAQLLRVKQDKVERYLERSRRCGTLTDDAIGYEACWKTVDGKDGRCRRQKGHEGDCAPW